MYMPDEFAPRKSKYRIKGKTFENVSFSKTKLSCISFLNCTFRDCLFVASHIIDCEFHDCIFANCNTHKIVTGISQMGPEPTAPTDC
jgi:uncharacterized protein YjbI with pentapeptide repeats